MSASVQTVAPAVAAPRRVHRILSIGLGVFIGLAAVGWLAATTGASWILGSFGATCVLVFGFPDASFSRPRSVIGGHVIASTTGLLFLHLFGPGWLPLAGAGACAAMLMMLTDTVHPPAGSNPVIVMLSQPGWSFLLMPTLAGACLLALLGWLYRRAMRAR